jgi:MFS family permease
MFGTSIGDVNQVFRSFRARNFRMFFAGQLISMIGMWMQEVGLLWLVLRLTSSGFALGGVAAASFGPMLLLGMWGGLIADRVNKRLVLFMTQAAMALFALILGIIALTGAETLWALYLLALLNGCAFAIDNPTRRAFLSEIVGPEDLSNAVSLWGALSATSRVIGPALAGVLIATTDVAFCFLLNATSYLAVIAALLCMNMTRVDPISSAPRAKSALRKALRYVWSQGPIRVPIIMMAIIGTLSFNFEVLLPILARSTFHRGPETFGLMMALASAGYVVGSLLVASRPVVTERYVATSALAFGVLILLVSASGSLVATLVALVAMGVGANAFISSSNAAIQVACEPAMLGRVMALFGALFLGSAPIGGPIVGWVAGTFGARVGLAVGGVAAVTTGVAALLWCRNASSHARAARGKKEPIHH